MTVKCKSYKNANALLKLENYKHGSEWNTAVCNVYFRLREAEKRLQWAQAREEYFTPEYDGLVRNIKAGRHLLSVAFQDALETLEKSANAYDLFWARTVLSNIFNARNFGRD